MPLSPPDNGGLLSRAAHHLKCLPDNGPKKHNVTTHNTTAQRTTRHIDVPEAAHSRRHLLVSVPGATNVRLHTRDGHAHSARTNTHTFRNTQTYSRAHTLIYRAWPYVERQIKSVCFIMDVVCWFRWLISNGVVSSLISKKHHYCSYLIAQLCEWPSKMNICMIGMSWMQIFFHNKQQLC